MAEPTDIIETVESLLSQIPQELQAIIKHMNEAGVTDIIPTHENLLSQIPEALISIITQMNESLKCSTLDPP
jgi:predicted ATPase